MDSQQYVYPSALHEHADGRKNTSNIIINFFLKKFLKKRKYGLVTQTMLVDTNNACLRRQA